MIRLVYRATLLAVVGVTAASIAMAGLPSGTTSIINAAPQGAKILMSGRNLGNTTADNNTNYANQFLKIITVKDAGGFLVPNSVVQLNFNSAYGTNGIKVGQNQPGVTYLGHAYPVTVSIGGRTISATTGNSGATLGVVAFKVCGGGNHAGGNADPEPGNNQISVTADSQPLGTLSAAYFDQNGADCINVADFGLYANDFTGTVYRVRSDYDFDGVTANDVGDFGFFANAFTQSDFGGNNCANGGSTGPMVP